LVGWFGGGGGWWVFVLWMWVGMGGRTKVEIVDMVAVLVSMCDCLRWGSVDVALLAVYF
jgi:hypothetical protein